MGVRSLWSAQSSPPAPLSAFILHILHSCGSWELVGAEARTEESISVWSS